MIATTVLLAFSSFSAFALSMPAHRRAALDGTLTSRIPRALFVAIGSTLALLAVFSASRTTGWPLGIVLWLAALSIAGFAVTLTLTYFPRRLPLISVATLTFTLAAALLLQ